MRDSVKNQSLLNLKKDPPKDLADLPANFPGRNVPDISLNADPDTGYILLYTSDQTGFSVEQFGGGTSFVAPQINGITALYAQALGHRVGLLNIPLYQLLRDGNPYTGKKAAVAGYYAGRQLVLRCQQNVRLGDRRRRTRCRQSARCLEEFGISQEARFVDFSGN
jgi:hypothetical protein